jgi:hypothetical protein
MSKRATCLPQNIHIIHAIGQQFVLFLNKLLFCSSYHSKNLVRSSTDRVCPITFGLRIRTHIIYVAGHVEEVRLVNLLACQGKCFRHAFQADWQKIQRIKKVKILHNHS